MRLVFHHIPKTGGGSLVAAFRTFGPISYNSGDCPFLTTHLPYELSDYPERLHLTILRDPIERLISWVRYKRTTVSPAGELARRLPASEFLRSSDVSVAHCARDRQVRQLGGDFYTDPIPDSEALDRALTRLDQMFWVGETETLDTDMGCLFDQLELVNPQPDRWNVSDGPPDIDDLAVLEELNVWDRRLIEGWHDRSR